MVLASRVQLPVLENFVLWGYPGPHRHLGACSGILQQAGSEWNLVCCASPTRPTSASCPQDPAGLSGDGGHHAPAYSYFADYRFRFVLEKQGSWPGSIP